MIVRSVSGFESIRGSEVVISSHGNLDKWSVWRGVEGNNERKEREAICMGGVRGVEVV